jgi:hypothetical protein
MLHAVLVLASSEHSKVPFYIVGSAFALWAIILSFLGLSRADFPGSESRSRMVFTVSIVLAVASMATAVATS